MFNAVRRCWRPSVLAVAISGLMLAATGQAILGYNNYDMPCGTWPNGTSVGVQWKWGPDINTGGNWAYAFANVAEPNWDNTSTKIDLGYNSSAAGEYDVYNVADGNYGRAYVWCHWWDTDQIADFLAEGNLSVLPDATWDNEMAATAAHEVGHTLGLGHSTSAAVMNPSYSYSSPQTDDVNGLNALYP